MTLPTANAQNLPADLASKYPGLRVTVKIGTKRDQVEDSFYRKTMTITPSVGIEGSSTRPMPAASMTMLVITMDTEEKYRHRREAYVVWSKETVAVPAVEVGTRRDFAFKSSQVTFDAYRDASNVGGMVYKYYVFGLRDEATNELIYFETNHSKLAALVRRSPEKREEFLKLAAKGEFPADIK
ncbi:hypothetical protein [Phragmitibacter flavus]|uniref:hypothetical protein n=1 Tax=Phragmitibacter flavus TaxID=2576071 RepID=UPI0010FD35C6|nr:hypothetical protein [Phragmitibacter flavus]